ALSVQTGLPTRPGAVERRAARSARVAVHPATARKVSGLQPQSHRQTALQLHASGHGGPAFSRGACHPLPPAASGKLSVVLLHELRRGESVRERPACPGPVLRRLRPAHATLAAGTAAEDIRAV